MSGKVTPEMEKPAPLTVAELIVNGPVPLEVSMTVCVVGVLTDTFPKLTVDVLTPNVGIDAFSCIAKVLETPPALAVRVAVCAVDTAATVALNVALVAPAAIVTEVGTATAALLLARLTAKPPAGAAAFVVTVHASVADPVMDEFVHESAVSTGTPVPVSVTAVVVPVEELLVSTI